MSNLLDYSFAAVDPEKIKDNGFVGVMRYVSPNAGKNLTSDELSGLRSHGIAVGLVWEWYAKRAAEGRDAGVQDAHAALSQSNALGFPDSAGIYFAIDWDIADAAPDSGDARAKLGAVADYFDGVISVLGLGRVGAYGGYYAIKRLFDAGLITYGWQTYAWSGGQWDERAQLRQTLNGQWSGSVDFGEIIHENWGQLAANGSVSPSPAPEPPAPATGTGKHTIVKDDTFWGLEAANGWTHGTLQNLNPGVDPTKLKIGSQINVPGGTEDAPQPTPAPKTHQYAIQKNDTFWGLENANSWPHGTLQGLNPQVTDPTKLQIGQLINLPTVGAVPPTVVQHTVTIESGDTFWGLEAEHGWTHGTLQALNPGVDPLDLGIGSVINVPA